MMTNGRLGAGRTEHTHASLPCISARCSIPPIDLKDKFPMHGESVISGAFFVLSVVVSVLTKCTSEHLWLEISRMTS